MKKLLLAAASVALPVGLIASTASLASAAAPGVNVTHASITCTTVTGAAKFAPALTATGGNPENTTVKLVIGGCTVSGAPGVTISGGKGSGVLHSASNSAIALLGPVAVTGQVNVKWTSNVALTAKSSSVNVTVVTGGTSGSFASLAVTAGHATVTGDFAGTNGGATSTLYSETTQTVSALTTAAAGAKGLKGITLGTSGAHLHPNSLHLA